MTQNKLFAFNTKNRLCAYVAYIRSSVCRPNNKFESAETTKYDRPSFAQTKPIRILENAWHEKNIYRDKRRSTCEQPGRRAAVVPLITVRKPVTVFSHSVYSVSMDFRLFVSLGKRSDSLSTMPWRQQGRRVVSWASRPAPPRPALPPCAAPPRPARGIPRF